jgi:hypothetical protein
VPRDPASPGSAAGRDLMFPARRVFGHDDRLPSGDRTQAAPEAGVPTGAMDRVARSGKADQAPQ